MGLGPPVIELYRQLRLQGALDGVTNVMELGSQDFWCPQKNLVRSLFAAFDRGEPDPALLNTTNTSQLPARVLYEGLGITYNCVDVDGRSGTLVLDMNFDSAPEEHWNKLHLRIIFYGREHCTARGCDGTVCEICRTLFPGRKALKRV